MNEIKEIDVIGRRWFDRINGNTYCASKVFVNGQHVATTGWEYGYDDYYIQAAGDELSKMGIIQKDHKLQPLWAYCSDNDIKFNSWVKDVLKRDMVAFSEEVPHE